MSEIQKKLIELKGHMLLEGPFLEQIMAGCLLKDGKDVVPKFETGGVLYDILVKTIDGYIIYECTGQRDITEEKIDRFHHNVLELHDVLMKIEGKGIVEAVFAASVNDDAWASNVKDAIAHVKSSFEKRISANLKVISGLDLIKELIKSGILGLRLVKGKVHFAGPEDYAIRYIPDEKAFKMSFAPMSYMQLLNFRKLPHSFLPSYYWEKHYEDLYIESSEGKEEPLTIWSYYYEEGLMWPTIKDMVETYYDYLNLNPHIYIMEKGEDYLIEEYESRRKNRYYTIHMFSNKDKIDSSVAGTLMGKAIRLIDKIKTERGSYLEKEPFSIYIHSATEDWSFKAWGELMKGIPKPLIDDVSTIVVERGNEFLLNLLNRGVLGLSFRTKNEITLVGPGIEAIRMSKVDSDVDITISKEPY